MVLQAQQQLQAVVIQFFQQSHQQVVVGVEIQQLVTLDYLVDQEVEDEVQIPLEEQEVQVIHLQQVHLKEIMVVQVQPLVLVMVLVVAVELEQ